MKQKYTRYHKSTFPGIAQILQKLTDMKKKTCIELIAIVMLLLTLAAGCKKNGDDNTDNTTPSGLLYNSFDKITTYPAPGALNYTRKNGSLTKGTVFPGQVVVLVSGSSDAVTLLVAQNNGTISAQVPNAGLYLATMNPANVSAFLSAMFKSSIVADAFPNSVVTGNGFTEQGGVKSANGSAFVNGDKNSIVQTLDLSTQMGCSDNIDHKEAVGAVAAANGVSVNVNDVTVYNKDTESAGTDSYKTMQKMLGLLNWAFEHNQPVVINMSMNGDESVELDNYWYNKRFCYLLEAVEKQNPRLLDNAVIIVSGANANVNETEDYTQLYQNDFGNSPIWDHLYFSESQEGQNGCGLGYVNQGTPNVLSAPACHISIPNSVCTRSGNSFSAPYLSGLVAQTYEMLKKAGSKMKLPEITAKLWQYQTENNGKLPTAGELYSICAGNGGFGNKYDGIWTGTCYYTAAVPQPSGTTTIVKASFTLSITLVSAASVPGYPQMLTVTSVTCSDPTFGATSGVVPAGPLSIALLPATFGSASLSGMGITIDFPNGSNFFTSNSIDGAFTIDANGRNLASTNLVSTAAFSAGGQVEDSNLPGSGPGGYAYNWCTFTSWSLVR